MCRKKFEISVYMNNTRIYLLSTKNLCLGMRLPWGQDLRGRSDLGGLYEWMCGIDEGFIQRLFEKLDRKLA
jgi:hypothetical protein